ncbi:hypothetical protein [Streptomyces sp. SD31]|uniref:hypothetical protein n=1 Tax=Streptomyces sp. SD31 TaxID=3452208 RepID=UPI003F888E7B
MTDERRTTQDKTDEPVPRDLPDQQANPAQDPWEVSVEPADASTEGDDVPDTDEAGTGRQGAARSDTVHPEHPEPEEPSG